MFYLRFAKNQIGQVAERYAIPIEEGELLELKPVVQRRGFLTREELKQVSEWKAARVSGMINNNQEDYVIEVTKFALATPCERARIEALNILDGVYWPTASVILHFFHEDPYPIIDYRALWSLSVEGSPTYTFDYWWNYVKYCREMAVATGVDMRTLDRALWQFSKEKQ